MVSRCSSSKRGAREVAKCTRRKLTEMRFNGFMASSACVHKIIKHADDVSELLILPDFVGYFEC